MNPFSFLFNAFSKAKCENQERHEGPGPYPFEPRWKQEASTSEIIQFRKYRIALVWDQMNIIGTVVDSIDDALQLERSESFIKWATGWVVVKL